MRIVLQINNQSEYLNNSIYRFLREICYLIHHTFTFIHQIVLLTGVSFIIIFETILAIF